MAVSFISFIHHPLALWSKLSIFNNKRISDRRVYASYQLFKRGTTSPHLPVIKILQKACESLLSVVLLFHPSSLPWKTDMSCMPVPCLMSSLVKHLSRPFLKMAPAQQPLSMSVFQLFWCVLASLYEGLSFPFILELLRKLCIFDYGRFYISAANRRFWAKYSIFLFYIYEPNTAHFPLSLRWRSNQGIIEVSQ